MPRLLLLCEFPTLAGGEMSMLATLGTLAEAGYELHAVSPAESELAASLEAAHVVVHPWPNAQAPLANRREALAGIVRRVQPTLVHANSLSMTRLAGPVMVALETPSLGHIRDIVRLSSRAVADVNCHARLLAVSQATRDAHVAQGVDAARTHVLFNGVDLQRFAPRPPTGSLHHELGLPPTARLVVSIGQLSLRKAPDVLLATAQQVAQVNDSIHFLLVGERYATKAETRALEEQLIEATQRGPVAGRWHMLGYRRDIAEVLREATLLVHCARQEPLGRVLLEAAATATPIVATRVGGTAEIFPPESEAAVLVEKDDVGQFATNIQALTEDAQRRAALGAAARRRVEQAFDHRLAANNLLAHYRAAAPDDAG